MGTATIMYLSKSKVGMLWKDKSRKKTILSGIKSNLSLSLNPTLNIEAEFERNEKTPMSRGGGDNGWPSFASIDVVVDIEGQLKKSSQIGTMEEFINRNWSYPFYKLKGKLFVEEMSRSDLRGGMKCHGTRGILFLDGTKKKVAVDIAYENVAGLNFRNEQWETWESGTMRFLDDVCWNGYELIGLFTYEGESDKYFAECGILYFANMSHKNYFRDKKIGDTVFNEYIQ
ncbi:MAG: hypothetical protein E7260_11190 [Lachnospiraceae bacterium]|nr:hypothetical protein [Lachnospiraceae bacterium]